MDDTFDKEAKNNDLQLWKDCWGSYQYNDVSDVDAKKIKTVVLATLCLIHSTNM